MRTVECEECGCSVKARRRCPVCFSSIPAPAESHSSEERPGPRLGSIVVLIAFAVAMGASYALGDRKIFAACLVLIVAAGVMLTITSLFRRAKH